MAENHGDVGAFAGKIFIVKMGAYKFKYDKKEGYDVGRNIGPIVGLELESRFPRGFAIGASYHYFENKAINLETGKEHELNSGLLVFPLKYYIPTRTSLMPVIGIGLGYGSARIPDLGRSYSDFITQLFFGLAYASRKIEYQLVYQGYLARLHESGPGVCFIECGGNLDISGRTLLFNLGIRFE